MWQHNTKSPGRNESSQDRDIHTIRSMPGGAVHRTKTKSFWCP